MGKGGQSSVWSQRVELSEWVDFVTRQIPIQNRRVSNQKGYPARHRELFFSPGLEVEWDLR